VAGSASPVGLTGVKTLADDSIHLGSNFVVGANKPDYHLRNANYPRDFNADIVGDIALAQEGHTCPNCASQLVARRGIEVGHIFKVGPRYSETLGAYFVDQDHGQHPIIMGCYGIGVERLLAAAIEQNHDDGGIVFPRPIAPYDVHLVALNTDVADVVSAADDLYANLEAAGLSVLYDDRHESPGVKFNDADLIGLPVRAVVSRRNVNQGVIEVKRRDSSDPVSPPMDEALATVQSLLES
jgi:prolyl-tRNA synthetase